MASKAGFSVKLGFTRSLGAGTIRFRTIRWDAPILIEATTGHLLWWSTNTRAASTLLAASVENDVPVFLVLDPAAPSPIEKYLDEAKTFVRERGPVSFDEFQAITAIAQDQLETQRLLMAPSSEYLQTLVHSSAEIRNLPDVETLPRSNLPYAVLSEKGNLSLLVARGLDFPLPRIIEPHSSDTPFVAKPKRNISSSGTLRPFLVHNTDTWDQYFAMREEFFAQEVVTGDSLYWCGIRTDRGEIRGYFQSNLAQVRGGGSISVAKRVADGQYPAEQEKLASFLTGIDYVGPIMFEFKIPSFTLIEINPRFWGPLYLDNSSRGGVLDTYFSSFLDCQHYVPIPGHDTELYVVPSLLSQSVSASESLWPMNGWDLQTRLILDEFGHFPGPEIGGAW